MNALLLSGSITSTDSWSASEALSKIQMRMPFTEQTFFEKQAFLHWQLGLNLRAGVLVSANSSHHVAYSSLCETPSVANIEILKLKKTKFRTTRRKMKTENPEPPSAQPPICPLKLQNSLTSKTLKNTTLNLYTPTHARVWQDPGLHLKASMPVRNASLRLKSRAIQPPQKFLQPTAYRWRQNLAGPKQAGMKTQKVVGFRIPTSCYKPWWREPALSKKASQWLLQLGQYLESRVAQNKKPPYPKVAVKSLNVSDSHRPLAFQVHSPHLGESLTPLANHCWALELPRWSSPLCPPRPSWRATRKRGEPQTQRGEGNRETEALNNYLEPAVGHIQYSSRRTKTGEQHEQLCRFRTARASVASWHPCMGGPKPSLDKM